MRGIALLLVICVLTACSPAQPAATPVPAATETAGPTATSSPPDEPTPFVQSAECPAVVAQALTAVDTACTGTGRNQVCYGNVQLTAAFRDGTTPASFDRPGDVANLSDVQTIDLSPLNADANEWGVALMRVQANLPDTLPGQNVTFLLFGDVEFETVPADGALPTSFYFRTGIGDSRCTEAPDSGILVQTPAGVSEVMLRLNGVDITLGSTAYLQAQPDSDLTVSVIEGRAEVESQGARQIVTAGNRTYIPMTADLDPAGPPSEPEPYQIDELRNLPVNNLERQISVASVSVSSDFVSDAEGWLNESGGPVEYHGADDTSDGAICSDLGVFVAPPPWRGDQSASTGGAIGLVARRPAGAASEILLEGGGLSLAYPLPPSTSTDWAALTVSLGDSSGWLNLSGGTVSDADLRTALTNVTALHVRGLGDGCIDDIQLNEAVVPTTPFVRSQSPTLPTAVAAGEGTRQTFEIELGASVGPDLPQDGIGEIDGTSAVDEFRFDGSTGQQVYFAARGEEGPIVWSLRAPDGTVLFERWRLWENNDPGVVVLPQTGTYSILVTGETSRGGTYRFAITEVGSGSAYDITPDTRVFEDNPGPGAGRIDTAGERDSYTFTLESPQDLYFSALGEQGQATWTLTGPDGEPVFEESRLWQGNDPGVFTLDPGTYIVSAAGQGESTGWYEFAVWVVPPPQNFELPLDTLVFDGQPEPGMGRIESPGAVDVYTLELTEATELRFAAMGENPRAAWSLIGPDGDPIFEDSRLWQGNDPGALTLDAGEYTVRVTGDIGQFGTYRFVVSHVETAEAGPAAGARLLDVADEVADVGEQQNYTFDAQPGQTLFLQVDTAPGTMLWVLTDGDGIEVFNAYRGTEASVGPVTLESGGPFTLSAAAYDVEAAGPLGFVLWNVPPPESFEIEIGDVIGAEGVAGMGRIELPGAKDVYTFTAEPGQQIFGEMVESTLSALWTLVDEDGTQIFNGYRSTGSNLGLITLERGGLYTLTVAGYNTETGTYRARLWRVPEPDMIRFEIGDAIAEELTGPGSGNIESPGARDIYMFEAEPGQMIFIAVPSSELSALWTLLDEDGTQVFNGYRSSGSIGLLTLERGGTYTLTVSGYDIETGRYRATTWDVPAPDTTSIELDRIVEGDIEVPGASDVYTFDADAGREIVIELTAAESTLLWELSDADGEVVLSTYRSAPSEVWRGTLEAGGSYTLRVSGYDVETGGYRFLISSEE